MFDSPAAGWLLLPTCNPKKPSNERKRNPATEADVLDSGAQADLVDSPEEGNRAGDPEGFRRAAGDAECDGFRRSDQATIAIRPWIRAAST